MRAGLAALVLAVLAACGAENAPVPPPAKDAPQLGLSITGEAAVGVAKDGANDGANDGAK